jgi:hypothetical protein
LGEIPPPLPRCRHCHYPVKGHKGPWGVGRCTVSVEIIKLDSFFKQTIKAYGEALDKAMMEDHPLSGVLGRLK